MRTMAASFLAGYQFIQEILGSFALSVWAKTIWFSQCDSQKGENWIFPYLFFLCGFWSIHLGIGMETGKDYAKERGQPGNKRAPWEILRKNLVVPGIVEKSRRQCSGWVWERFCFFLRSRENRQGAIRWTFSSTCRQEEIIHEFLKFFYTSFGGL